MKRAKKFIIPVFLTVMAVTMSSQKMMSAQTAAAHTLFWDMNKGDHVEVVKTADVLYRINNENQETSRERNIIDLYCTGSTGGKYDVNSIFSLYSLHPGDTVFKLDSKTRSVFRISRNGEYLVDDRTYLPNLRSIPTFPDGDITVNSTWEKPGALVFDNFSVPFKIEMPVNYRLAAINSQESASTAEILFKYTVDYTLDPARFPQDFPQKITGRSEGVITWDLKKNIPVAIRENYRMAFIFARGNNIVIHEWLMAMETDYTNYQKNPEPVKDLSDEIDPDTGVTVAENDRGLVFTLGEVLFDFNSSDIRKDSSEVIDKITAIIKRDYPDREIIVEGHTDNTGSTDYNRNLSEKRAENVAERILSKIDHDKVSYIGQGETLPVADNNSAEGRKKNRRVEIIVKTK